jgi:hypothetical protein
MKRLVRSLFLALTVVTAPAVVMPDAAPQAQATWYYTTSNGVWTYTRVWQPLPGGGGYWAPYSIGVYLDPVSTPLGYSQGW